MTKTTTDRQKVRDSHPDSWIAVEAGDSIMGKITDVTDAWSDQRRDPATGRQGSSYPLLTIEAEEANGYDNLPRELKVHCFGAVLFNEIMRKQPNIGERIRITYQGAGEAKPGQNAPELYAVRAASNTDVARRAYETIADRSSQPVAAPTGGGGQPPAQGTLENPDEDIPF